MDPGLKQEYIKNYGNNYIIPSKNNKYLMKIFHELCSKNKILNNRNKLFEYMYKFEDKSVKSQFELF